MKSTVATVTYAWKTRWCVLLYCQ